MAAKIEYVVVAGCIQEGTKVVSEGEVYVPPSTEVRDVLLKEGVIARRGALEPAPESDD